MKNKDFISCPSCKAKIGRTRYSDANFHECPSCDKSFELHLLPGDDIKQWRKELPKHAPEVANDESQARCHNHETNKANDVCESCGILLCTLCSVPLADTHWCIDCIVKGKDDPTNPHFIRKHELKDNVALAVAFAPMVIFFFWFTTLITAPITLVLIWKNWNKPLSLLKRTKVRFVIAAIVALLQLIGWAAIFAGTAGVFD